MATLLKYEMYKFFVNKKNWLVLFLLIMYLMSLVLTNHVREKEYIERRDSLISADNYEANAMIVVYDKNYRETRNPESKALLEFWKQRQSITQELSANYRFYKNENSFKILALEIQYAENELLGYENGYFFNISPISLSRYQELKKTIYTNQFFINYRITPDKTPYQLSIVQYFYYLISGFVPLTLMVIVLLFNMDTYAIEMENGSYKFLYTQKFTREKIYFSKFIASTLASMVSFIFSSIIVGIFVFKMYGKGDLNYPIAVLSDSGSYYMMDKKGLILAGYILLLLIFLFVNVLLLWISVYAKSSSNTFCIVAIILLLTYCIETFYAPSFLKKTWILAYYPITEKLIDVGIHNVMRLEFALISISIVMLIILFQVISRKDLPIGGSYE